jgi:hypothetical protein
MWVGYVYDPKEGEVVTMCVMHTESECDAWLDDAIKRKAWLDESELPDASDTNH